MLFMSWLSPVRVRMSRQRRLPAQQFVGEIRRFLFGVGKPVRRSRSAFQFIGVSVEFLEQRRTPTTPPSEIANALTSLLTALNAEIPARETEYNNGIQGALGDIWSDVGSRMTEGTGDLNLSGSNWNDFTSSASASVISDVGDFLGDTGLYLAGMLSDVQGMLGTLSLPTATLPSTINWTDVGGTWYFEGSDESISPFVGPPGSLPGTNTSIRRANGNVRLDGNGNIVIEGRFGSEHRTVDSTGTVLSETYALYSTGMMQLRGGGGSIQGFQLQYYKNDHPSADSGSYQHLVFEGNPLDAGNARVTAAFGRREGNNGIGLLFDKPSYQSDPNIAGYITFTGSDHTIQLSAGKTPADPSQNFFQGLLSVNKPVGTGEGALTLSYSDQNNTRSMNTQFILQNDDVLMKMQSSTSNAFGGMWQDWNVAGSAIYRMNTPIVPTFLQVGYQKSKDGLNDFFATDTFLGTPNYSLAWRNQGFVMLPDPGVAGGYWRVYAAVPLPSWLLPTQSPNAYGFMRKKPSVIMGVTGPSPFNQPTSGLEYFLGVSSGF